VLLKRGRRNASSARRRSHRPVLVAEFERAFSCGTMSSWLAGAPGRRRAAWQERVVDAVRDVERAAGVLTAARKRRRRNSSRRARSVTADEALTDRAARRSRCSLDEESASLVLAKMNEHDIRRLSDAVEDLGDVGSDLIMRVLEELERNITDPLAMVATVAPRTCASSPIARSATTARRNCSRRRCRRRSRSCSCAARASTRSRSCSPTSIRRSPRSC
jgi:hypothetical protein